jgi:hypothetical protein
MLLFSIQGDKMKTFIQALILLMLFISPKVLASGSMCSELFNISEIVLFPVPPGEFGIRNIGNGYFALISNIPVLPPGSIFEVRTKEDIRMPEEGSRLLLLKEAARSKNLNREGRWMVVRSNPFLKEVYTSEIELNQMITSVLGLNEQKEQFDPADLRFLAHYLGNKLNIDMNIATEVATNYGKLPNSTNVSTVRQFPRIIKETLKRYKKDLIILDENGDSI